MTSHFGWAARLTATAVVGLTLLTVGCAHRYYDADHNDYHRWNSNETVYYNQWVTENQMDAHRDYRHLSKEDQKRYWDWRHNHDHDRDNDRDHDRDRH
jgi:ribonuclease HI